VEPTPIDADEIREGIRDVLRVIALPDDVAATRRRRRIMPEVEPFPLVDPEIDRGGSTLGPDRVEASAVETPEILIPENGCAMQVPSPGWSTAELGQV
jgi:hypothetical protein